MKLITQLLVTSMMGAALLPMTVLAQNSDARNQGYLVDSRGRDTGAFTTLDLKTGMFCLDRR